MDDHGQIREILGEVNDAWRVFPPGQIAPAIGAHFAEHAVIAGPGLARVARGRDAAARSYDDFASSAKILSSELESPEIDIVEDVAVATLKWRMRYEYRGAESSEAGSDIYVLNRQGGRWLICWRLLESHPAE